MGDHRIARTILVLGLLAIASARASGQGVILGVLEDVPGIYAGEPNSRRVRVVFERDNEGWVSLPSRCAGAECIKTFSSRFPSETSWTISFDGRSLGKVTGRWPQSQRTYSAVGFQEITDEKSAPVIGQRSREFGGFTEESVYRPLIAISQPYFNDPDGWKPIVPSPELLEKLRQSFKKKFPKLCRTSPQDETKLVPLLYHSADANLVKAYASRKGWTLARLHLEDAIDCGDTEAGFGIEDPWFVIDPQKSTRYLDSGIWLVDAGDYDNDGKSELVFSIDRYNRGGYEIFYNNFTKHAVFEFSYH